jgi:hypothetical protein
MAAPLGNQNAARGRVWRTAIERALAEKSKGEQMDALNSLANALIAKAMDGDMTALKELGDRLDGKPAQSLDLGSDPDRPMIHEIVRRIVNAGN